MPVPAAVRNPVSWLFRNLFYKPVARPIGNAYTLMRYAPSRMQQNLHTAEEAWRNSRASWRASRDYMRANPQGRQLTPEELSALRYQLVHSGKDVVQARELANTLAPQYRSQARSELGRSLVGLGIGGTAVGLGAGLGGKAYHAGVGDTISAWKNYLTAGMRYYSPFGSRTSGPRGDSAGPGNGTEAASGTAGGVGAGSQAPGQGGSPPATPGSAGGEAGTNDSVSKNDSSVGSFFRSPGFLVPAGLASAFGAGYLGNKLLGRRKEDDEEEKSSMVGHYLARHRDQQYQRMLKEAADFDLAQMPYSADQAATVTGADPIITATAHNRRQHPLNYWLNPLVRGPLSELYWRAKRRMAAGTMGNSLGGKALGFLGGQEPETALAGNPFSILSLGLGDRDKRDEARSLFANSHMGSTVQRIAQKAREQRKKRQEEEKEPEEKDAAEAKPRGLPGVSPGEARGWGSGTTTDSYARDSWSYGNDDTARIAAMPAILKKNLENEYNLLSRARIQLMTRPDRAAGDSIGRLSSQMLDIQRALHPQKLIATAKPGKPETSLPFQMAPDTGPSTPYGISAMGPAAPEPERPWYAHPGVYLPAGLGALAAGYGLGHLLNRPKKRRPEELDG